MKKVSLIAIALLSLALVFLYAFQDNLIFRSQKLEKNYVFTFSQPFEEVFIPMDDNQSLNALIFHPAIPSKGLILYFHGNANNLQRWGRYAPAFTDLGYDVLMIDYRGYGKSTGYPSESALYSDSEKVLDWAAAKLSYTKLVIYGRSLGSAVASHLAISANPDLLILETPFDELRGALSPVLQPVLSILPLKYEFPNKEHLAEVKCKTVIFHGTHDKIVPLSSALRLRPLLREGDEFIVIPEGTHRNLGSFDAYKKKLEEVLR